MSDVDEDPTENVDDGDLFGDEEPEEQEVDIYDEEIVADVVQEGTEYEPISREEPEEEPEEESEDKKRIRMIKKVKIQTKKDKIKIAELEDIPSDEEPAEKGYNQEMRELLYKTKERVTGVKNKWVAQYIDEKEHLGVVKGITLDDLQNEKDVVIGELLGEGSHSTIHEVPLIVEPRKTYETRAEDVSEEIKPNPYDSRYPVGTFVMFDSKIPRQTTGIVLRTFNDRIYILDLGNLTIFILDNNTFKILSRKKIPKGYIVGEENIIVNDKSYPLVGKDNLRYVSIETSIRSGIVTSYDDKQVSIMCTGITFVSEYSDTNLRPLLRPDSEYVDVRVVPKVPSDYYDNPVPISLRDKVINVLVDGFEKVVNPPPKEVASEATKSTTKSPSISSNIKIVSYDRFYERKLWEWFYETRRLELLSKGKKEIDTIVKTRISKTVQHSIELYMKRLEKFVSPQRLEESTPRTIISKIDLKVPLDKAVVNYLSKYVPQKITQTKNVQSYIFSLKKRVYDALIKSSEGTRLSSLDSSKLVELLNSVNITVDKKNISKILSSKIKNLDISGNELLNRVDDILTDIFTTSEERSETLVDVSALREFVSTSIIKNRVKKIVEKYDITDEVSSEDLINLLQSKFEDARIIKGEISALLNIRSTKMLVKRIHEMINDPRYKEMVQNLNQIILSGAHDPKERIRDTLRYYESSSKLGLSSSEASLIVGLQRNISSGENITGKKLVNIVEKILYDHILLHPITEEDIRSDVVREYIYRNMPKSIPKEDKKLFDSQNDIRAEYKAYTDSIISTLPEVSVTKSISPKKSHKTNIRQDVSRYEELVFSTKGKSIREYLENVLLPVMYLEHLAGYPKVFHAKIHNGEYNIGALASATFSHYFPEITMNLKLTNDDMKDIYATLSTIMKDIVDTFLYYHIIYVTSTRTIYPSRLDIGTVLSLKRYLVDPLKVCGNPDIKDLGDLIVCYDDVTRKFNCSSKVDVLRSIKFNKGINPHTQKMYPKELIDRLKDEAMHVEQVTQVKISPKKVTPPPKKYKYQPTKVTKPKPTVSNDPIVYAPPPRKLYNIPLKSISIINGGIDDTIEIGVRSVQVTSSVSDDTQAVVLVIDGITQALPKDIVPTYIVVKNGGNINPVDVFVLERKVQKLFGKIPIIVIRGDDVTQAIPHIILDYEKDTVKVKTPTKSKKPKKDISAIVKKFKLTKLEEGVLQDYIDHILEDESKVQFIKKVLSRDREYLDQFLDTSLETFGEEKFTEKEEDAIKYIIDNRMTFHDKVMLKLYKKVLDTLKDYTKEDRRNVYVKYFHVDIEELKSKGLSIKDIRGEIFEGFVNYVDTLSKLRFAKFVNEVYKGDIKNILK